MKGLSAATRAFLACALHAAATARAISAQEADPLPSARDSAAKYETTIAGEFTPGSGFDVIKTSRGSLNISMYGLFRFVHHNPPDQEFTDHLGRTRTLNPRNDINWHRTFVWLTGFFYVPQFRYNVSLWSLPTTQQTLLFGNLQYRFSRAFGVGMGVAPNLTARSLTGSWPYWAGSDRLMAEEFFRGGFSSGFWITGEPVSRLQYTFSVNNNISQLGVVQANDTRDMMLSGNLRWQPTTGEFGPRNGFGDLEHHERLATQFGVSGAVGRESRYAPLGSPPNATQIKLSDGINPFDADAMAPGVTVTELDYEEMAADAGFKYRGFSFQSEYYVRRLDNFLATGPLPRSSILDHGFMAEAMHMVVKRRLGLYVLGGYVFDDFDRKPWELGGGATFYPTGMRAWRLNAHLIHVEKSPAASSFGYYVAGLTGTIISIGTDFLF